jgi:hypothetical protein
MKKSLAVIAILISGIAFAQDSNLNVVNNAGNSMVAAANGMKSSYGSSAYFVNPARAVDGTVYLFEEWNNSGVIHATTDQRFALNNINLNIERNSFESKVGKDSLFSFNFNNIEKFVINGRTFKNYYWNDDNRVYEIIYEAKDWSIIKGFKIVEVTGSANPMLNRSRDRMVRKMFYYVKDENGISPFILKKRKVLKLVSNGDAAKSAKIANYAKNSKLSYKREDDLRKIIEFGLKN